MRFKDRVVLITGAGRGIGKITAQRFAQEGAKVAICDINEEFARTTCEEINKQGGQAVYQVGDIAKTEDVQKIVTNIINAFGTIHILVNNAGVVKDLLLKKMTEEDWDLVVDTCLKGAFLCSKYVSPYMVSQNYGKIINISSRAYLGNPGQANYSSAKAGIIGLTRALAKELGRYSINVNAVAPGLTETEMLRAHPKYEMIKERAAKDTPLPRIGYPEDVANAIMFFASDEASYITGDLLHVTGGRFG
ncbi:MAG: 3-oxoacyl-ACP reductase FabG [Peptococcaceae bacterium]